MKLHSIEIVEDRTGRIPPEEQFLRIRRLLLRNVYEDGSKSEAYACDMVSRPGSDAVVALLYEIDGKRRVRVLLRDAPRPPVYLRRDKEFVQPDPREYLSLTEAVAGMMEPGDGPGPDGLRRRASVEAREEAGIEVAPDRFEVVGGETFASPGTGDEKVYYCAGPARAADAGKRTGDGTVMEEHSRLVCMELGEAIEACRTGRIPDMKTELGLLRLADHLGYLPQLDCFADELPGRLRDRHRRLGVAPNRHREMRDA